MLALNIEQYEYMKGAQDEAGIKVIKVLKNAHLMQYTL
jgi:hypothetical protein